MKANKKKIIILVSLVVLLVATGCLNYFLTIKAKDSGDPVGGDAQVTFFSTYRADREATRAQEVLYLEDIITSASSTEEVIATAQEKKIGLVSNMEVELALEGLIKAKGFEDCIVTISSNNVNVVVKDSELSVQEAAQIFNIIVTETDYPASNVIIIPYV